MGRALAVCLVFPVLAAFAGCGRSGIDDEDLLGPDASLDGARDARIDGARDAAPDGLDARPDVGPDVGDARRDAPDSEGGVVPCGASTCQAGCCLNGVCQGGSADRACGGFGTGCTDCIRNGFDRCEAAQKVCVRVTVGCGPQNCGGCCETFGGQEVCLGGRDPNACGSAGTRCQPCVNGGQVCDQVNRTCTAPPTCGPSNCAGCCQDNVCATGQATATCGASGAACADCTAQGGVCAPTGVTGGQCRITPPTCGPLNCTGCCQGTTCVVGTRRETCGAGGAACQDCGTGTCRSLVPAGGVCEGPPPPPCGPGTCAGCCQGNTCMAGTIDGVCGADGQACRPCAAGDQCRPAQVGGGVCTAPPPPPCGAVTCAVGCCINGLCAVGTQATACGTGGLACQDCSATALECRGQACQPPPPTCGPTNCAGCCQNGACNAGFLNNQCGSQGNACVNCTSRATTCDIGTAPRACRSQTSTCPATYGGCAPGTTTPSPTRQQVCAASLLANARAACSAGPDSAACAAFFAFVQGTAPTCDACLSPFRAPFAEGRGIFRCLAPFVTAQCNASTGCAVSCQDSSCSQCAEADRDACEAEVRQTQCSAAFRQSQCINPAFFGQGSFCNPLAYGGNFGQWIQAVGSRYCLR